MRLVWTVQGKIPGLHWTSIIISSFIASGPKNIVSGYVRHVDTEHVCGEKNINKNLHCQISWGQQNENDTQHWRLLTTASVFGREVWKLLKVIHQD